MLERLRKALARLQKATTASSEPAPVIIGLRNPGSKYAGTRHNVGADAVAVLAARHGATFRSAPKGIPAEVADARIQETRVRLVLPTTFMNESGQAVGPIVRYFSPPTYLVAHDDIDLAYGKIRVHHSRGSGGHNGIKSIVSTTGGTEFWRLRIGVGRPPGRIDPADFVLQRFRPEEDADILIQEAADVLEAFVAGGAEAARQAAGDRNSS